MLSHSRIDVVPLSVHPQEVEAYAADFFRAVGTEATEADLGRILRWLWDAVARPVLSQLENHGGIPPRIWWCPSGLFAFLPLHAAGYHHTAGDRHPRTVIDHAVSSYTPTLRALHHARRSRARPGPPSVLVATMPTTPGASDLPGAGLEAMLIESCFGARATILDRPRAAEVRAALPRHTFAHFACHAVTDPEQPSHGQLLLSDHASDPFSVAQVSALQLKDAELAYLSACSTAAGALRLPEEAINLASAFQLAGFRHVVGTLWPIADSAAVNLAARVYAGLARDGSADDVALTLHDAVRALRAQVADRPSLWAAHVHVGA